MPQTSQLLFRCTASNSLTCLCNAGVQISSASSNFQQQARTKNQGVRMGTLVFVIHYCGKSGGIFIGVSAG